MPSLRQRVSTYFRQLSFIAEPRERSRDVGDGSFITRYLEGTEGLPTGPEILCGKEPNDMPDLPLAKYDTSLDSIVALTGPDEGLCGIKRNKLHLSAGPDIDYIDVEATTSSRSLYRGQRSNSATRSDQNANNSKLARSASRKNSIASVKDGKAKPDNQTTEVENVDNLNKNLQETEQEKSNECDDEAVTNVSSPIDGVSDWKQTTDDVYGLAASLYEKNLLTNEHTGSPVADCFGVVARSNCAAIALADGVNWGENARLAARSAIFGCLEYLNTAIFGENPCGIANNTKEVFISLLRSFWEAHACILETGGALSTLSCAVILPLSGDNLGKYVVCACNVGDSLGYVYSKIYGVREFTQGSHDIESMRDMRDALGALGPVDGSKPELGNLTLSMTIVESGDIVFLTSDGISDNFDPVVGKFAEPMTEEHLRKVSQNVEPQATTKRQNKSSTAATNRRHLDTHKNQAVSSSRSDGTPVRPPRTKKTHSVATNPNVATPNTTRPKYLRSHTFIEPRPKITSQSSIILRSTAGLPLVTGAQRHALSLLRLNDLFSYGINGTLRPCTTAKKLCHLLVNFAQMITSAKRKLLEQHENFYKFVANEQGIRREVEMSRNQQRAARKKAVDGGIFPTLPGKLDHASVCAWKVPNTNAITLPTLSVLPNYTETNF